MEVLNSIRKEVLELDYYKAGKTSKSKRRIKLSSNENLMGTSSLAIQGIKKSLSQKLNIYPDSKMKVLKETLVEFFRRHNFYIKEENIVFGDGSGEVINMLFALFLSENSTLILPEKSFILYYLHSKSKGAKLVEIERKDYRIDLEKIRETVNNIRGKKLVLFANPDNPTSTFISKEEIRDFISKISPEIPVIVDEAYIHFASLSSSVIDLIKELPNLIVTQTFSKAYGLAGLRVGYGVMNEEICRQIEKIRLPFNLSSLQQIGATCALKDDKFLRKTISYVAKGKKFLGEEFKKLGLNYLEPAANFFFVDLGEKAVELIDFLEARGITLRHLVDFGYPQNFARITIGLPHQNKLLIKRLKEFYGR
ncbi:MAG: histidinol-phosphate transaminase [Brevinematia bacterium]